MDTQLEILSLLLIIAAAQGYFLMFLLIKKRKKETSNIWLAMLVWLISSAILSQAFEINGILFKVLIQNPDLFGIIDPLVWLFGPFYFFFIYHLLKKRQLKAWEYLLHFSPAIIKLLSLIPFFGLSNTIKLNIINRMEKSSPGLSIEDYLLLLSILLYLLWASYQIYKYRTQAKNRNNINWLWYLNLVMIGAWFFQVVALGLHYFKLNPFPQSDYMVVLGWVIGVYAIGYIQWFESPEIKLPESKYAKSGLTKKQKSIFRKQLLKALTEEKKYKDPELNLNKLAQHLQISPHHLSEVINDEFELSYYDLINQYRIQEAQSILINPDFQHLTILAISLEAGFNSKSAFNRVFKKLSGKTPSEFRKTAPIRSGRSQ
ncbi:MAG: helix-turn-helix transcriptional regulator [Bacteroidota bacterium]